METKKSTEEKQWLDTKAMIGNQSLTLGPYFTYQLMNTPRRILFALSHHKFAAKMIGPNKRILEVGCSEGLCTLLLAEFAKKCVGIDIDEDAIEVAKKSFKKPNLEFSKADILEKYIGEFDALVSFDVIEHIFPQNEDQFFKSLVGNLTSEGMCVIGTPNITSDVYASAVTKAGHVNLYSGERLQSSMERYFKKVLIFSANDEMIHTGFTPMAHYLIGIGIGLKK